MERALKANNENFVIRRFEEPDETLQGLLETSEKHDGTHVGVSPTYGRYALIDTGLSALMLISER